MTQLRRLHPELELVVPLAALALALGGCGTSATNTTPGSTGNMGSAGTGGSSGGATGGSGGATGGGSGGGGTAGGGGSGGVDPNFSNWPAGELAAGDRPAPGHELSRPHTRSADRDALRRGRHLVRRADDDEADPGGDAGRQSDHALRAPPDDGRRERDPVARARRRLHLRHRAARDLPAQQQPAAPDVREEVRRRPVDDDDRGRHHDRGALLGRRHVHDPVAAGADVPRDQGHEVPRPRRDHGGGVHRAAAAVERPVLPTPPPRRASGAAATAGSRLGSPSCCASCPPTTRSGRRSWPATPR